MHHILFCLPSLTESLLLYVECSERREDNKRRKIMRLCATCWEGTERKNTMNDDVDDNDGCLVCCWNYEER